ncbi:hypothetical protein SAMN05216593_113117 [Pseudomonas asturiensis]|uniref:Uncharacterized protein n=1 Tax=Pseudomonas asturiensis TaxID=1190415 RepID=A0A1M7PU73_9PSED|nr:hypothetical protein [Pseudomonas asturiensis]SHN21009.1 hypothetical protein SAMN05216593_113117 [Pseudomonas asturiensis]
MDAVKGTGALEKASDLLEAIGSAPEDGDMQQLGSHGLLSKVPPGPLVDRGMIRRNPSTKRYKLGYRFLEIVRGAWLDALAKDIPR